MDEEKIIIDVEVKGRAEAEDDLAALNALTSQLEKNNAELLASNKELEKQGKTNTGVHKENAQQVEANTKAINKNAAESKALQDNLNKQSEATKKASLTTEQMTGALDKAVPGLGGMIQGIMGATKASLAFIATPMGVALAALAAVLGVVAMWFTKTEEGGDLLAKRFAQISAAVNVVIDTVVRVVDALIKIASGDIITGVQQLTGAFTGMGDEMEREVKLAGDLADAIDALEEAEMMHGVTMSANTVKIKELMLQSKNRMLTEEQKIEKLREAAKLEAEGHEESKRIQAEKLKLALGEFEKNALFAESRRKANETDIEYANRILTLQQEGIGIRQAVAKEVMASNQLDGESIVLKERLNNMIDMQLQKLQEQKEKEEEKRIADAEAAQVAADAQTEKDAVEKARLDQILQEYVDRTNTKALTDEEYIALTMKLGDEENEHDKKITEEQYKRATEDAAKQLKLKKEVETAKVKLTEQAMNAVGSLLNQQSKEFKAFSIIQALYNTYLAAQAAFSSQLIPLDPTSLPRAIAAAVFATAAGLGRVAQIASFAQGGDVKAFTIGGKDHSRGGTKFYGEDGTVFEAQRDEGMFILKREAHKDLISDLSERNTRFGGRSWFGRGASRLALGGTAIPVTVPSQQLSTEQLAAAIAEAVSAMPAPIVTVEDINAGQSRVSVVETQAQL